MGCSLQTRWSAQALNTLFHFTSTNSLLRTYDYFHLQLGKVRLRRCFLAKASQLEGMSQLQV